MPKGIYKRTKPSHLKGKKQSPELIAKLKIARKDKCGGWNKGKKSLYPAWNKGLIGLNSGKDNPFYGKKHTKESRKKIKVAGTGRKQSIQTIIKRIIKTSGVNHWNWKGGINPINDTIRKSWNYKIWRRACFQRDNFTCQKYGISGGRIVAHHINNFADFPELRFALDNGITLSEKAHREFHKKYGKHNNTKEQLNEFLNGRRNKN